MVLGQKHSQTRLDAKYVDKHTSLLQNTALKNLWNLSHEQLQSRLDVTDVDKHASLLQNTALKRLMVLAPGTMPDQVGCDRCQQTRQLTAKCCFKKTYGTFPWNNHRLGWM